MISIQSFTFNPFQENTYVLFDESKECIIVDPGCMDISEETELSEFIRKNDLKPVKLVNTHCHIDHVLGNDFVKRQYDIKLFVHKIDEMTLKAVEAYAPSYGFANYRSTEVDEYLEEGNQVTFGNSSLDILFTPGHAPGHVVLVNKPQNICIAGDVLFHRSIGRTDLPGGDFDTLIDSIHSKLFTLDDNMIIFPGHGPETNIGDEKKHNPFCKIS